MKNSVEALKTLKTGLLYDPAIPLLAIYQGKTVIQKGTCTCYVHSSTPYVEAKTWTQLKRPSTDEWIKKLWYICTVEYYSAIKRNAFESVLIRWMNLEPILQSEVNQKRKINIVF